MTALSFRTNAILVTLVGKVASCFPKARITLVGKDKDAWTPNIMEMPSEKYTLRIANIDDLGAPPTGVSHTQATNQNVRTKKNHENFQNFQKIKFLEHEPE